METATRDATAEFNQVLNDPARWVIKQGVPIFKPHERVDPASGKLIRVDVPKLYRIAQNIQKLERQGGVPIRMTLGHTEPGKPETEQPPIGGYYRNARVANFGPQGEPAVVVDEWLDPRYLSQRKNFPYRSAEYYDDSEQITGVALLTRDPYLDLGVVAYTRAGAGAVHYSRSDDSRRLMMYHFLTGETSMYPPEGQVGAPAVQPVTYAAPVQPAAGVTQQAPVPAPAPHAPVWAPPQATTYGNVVTPPVQQPQPSLYTGTWPGPAHQRANIGHPHQSGGAIYDSRRSQRPGRYATEPPIEGPPGGGGEQSDLAVVHDCLTQAVEALSRMMGGGGAAPEGPPQSPFPEESGPDEALSRGRASGRGGYPQQRGGYYSRQTSGQRRPLNYSPQGNSPNPNPNQPMRTISGLPVGYQLTLDQLQYQLRQSNEALRVLYYERDQADTEWCVSEVRRLAEAGYDVGEVELYELKNRPREQRAAYISHIAAKYQRIGTEALPPILGDPTPGQNANDQRGPLSREEMDQALRMTANDPDPNAFNKAVNYIRSGGQPTNYTNRISGYPQQQQPMQTPEAAAQLGYDPYPEPSANGY